MKNADFITANGMVLKVFDLGEYDRRCIVLTKEYGKITVFARGAKRMKSPYLAATNPFCYGKFTLLPSKDAYSLMGVEITNFFDELRNDYEATVLGMYFLEVADYYSRENNDDYELLKLLYVAVLALAKGRLAKDLVRAIFEIKVIAVNGEFPGLFNDCAISDTVSYTINRIITSDVTKLYSFDLTKEYTDELSGLANRYCSQCIHGNFKSLDFL